jgi:hypothetical protein
VHTRVGVNIKDEWRKDLRFEGAITDRWEADTTLRQM